MNRRFRWFFWLVAVCSTQPVSFLCADPISHGKPGSPELPLQYVGPALPHPKDADGGLLYSPGVQNIEISRANRKYPPDFGPDGADKRGWTYQHHVDLACWRGRLYAVWDMTTGKEDVPPFHVVYATSTNGFTWSPPQDVFPFNQAWNQRFHFYHSSNDRMLVFATGANPGNGKKKISEAIKKSMLVREISLDHQLGPIYTLIQPVAGLPPAYMESKDEGFAIACREAFNHRPLLEQQDYGVFLGERKMKWHDATNWPGNELGGENKFWTFGKAFCFYHRQDGELVGLCKLGYVTLSADEGTTWSRPVVPDGLVVGRGKVWAQKTPDGRYAMVYPPQNPGPRYPMAITTSDDGITFRDLRTVHGEVPPLRYGASGSKGNGPQYLRGIAEWAGDAQGLDTHSIWVIYSVNQEDIWVSRIPVPVDSEVKKEAHDTFDNVPAGLLVPGWNTYMPAWSSVRIAHESGGTNQFLELENREPVDYARAIRVFPRARTGEISFRVAAAQNDRGHLEIELLGERNARPIRLVFDDRGQMQCLNGQTEISLGAYAPETWQNFSIKIRDGHFSVSLNGNLVLADAAYAEPSAFVYALSFRTGIFRNRPIKESSQRMDLPNAEAPLPPVTYRIDDVLTSASTQP